MLYILSVNYSYRYEITLVRIMYAANSSILHGKEKTGQILGTRHQYLYKTVSLKIPHITNPYLLHSKKRKY